MIDNLKRRRLDLVWHASHFSSEEHALVFNGPVAQAAGFVDFFGEQEYMRVLGFDIDQLEKDGAIVEATDHPAYGQYAGDFTPYWLTAKGRQMLFEADYPIELNP